MDLKQLREILRLHALWARDASQGEKAKLREADLRGANLREADLRGADLRGADLRRANLRGAKLREADLRGADLRGADLRGADLRRANLRGADLHVANLRGADLHVADLRGADLREADLRGADLRRANLREADLHGANLREADLREADLREADLSEADLNEADLREADLHGADLTDANMEGTILDKPVVPVTKKLTGKASRSLRRAAAQQLPLQAAAFKKAFPEHYQVIAAELKGRPITATLLSDLVAKHAMQWEVTETQYQSSLQRLSPTPNEVLQLNVDIQALSGATSRMQQILESVRRLSLRSGHPVISRGSLFTIGWVRYAKLDDAKTLLIEEIQSDVPAVRFGLKDKDFAERLRSEGLSPEEIDSALALLEPFANRFYYDALSLAFETASELGYTVEMLSYAQKEQFGSPKSVYHDLPKHMGMREAKSSQASFIAGPVWRISPNPAKRRLHA